MDVPSTDLVGNFQEIKKRFFRRCFLKNSARRNGTPPLGTCSLWTRRNCPNTPHGVGGWLTTSKVMKIGWVGLGRFGVYKEQMMMQENRKSMEVINHQCFPGYSYAWIYIYIYMYIYLIIFYIDILAIYDM